MDINKDFLKKLDDLINKNEALNNELKDLKNEIKQESITEETKHVSIPVIPVVTKPEDVPEQPKKVTPIKDVYEKPQMVAAPQAKPIQPIANPIQPKPLIKQDNKIEKYIGENLINKIGIAILVLGIGFFVKYAADKDWISDVTRVIIGVICGLALIGIAYRMRQSYKAFSSVLVGGGISVLYFTFTLAYREYEPINQTVAFIIMLLITAFTIFLSINFNRKEIAIIAIIGGFTSPLMLSTGTGNYIVLFSYLLILNSGMLVLAYFKRWNIISIICYGLTLIIYGSWLGINVFYKNQGHHLGALFFASAFYMVFFLMNIINNLKEKKKFSAFEIIILISNAFFFYLAGMMIINHGFVGNGKGIFTASLAALHLVATLALYNKHKFDKVFSYLMIGLTITFTSLIAPIQFDGNFITIYWATEVALMFWIYQMSSITLLKHFSAGILVLVLWFLIIDWYRIYYYDVVIDYPPRVLPVLLNKGFLSGFISSLSILITLWLLKREPEDSRILGIKKYYFRPILISIVVLVLYNTFHLELKYQLNEFFDFVSTRRIITYSFNTFFFLLLLAYASKHANQWFLLGITIISLLLILSYPMGMNYNVMKVRAEYLEFNTIGIGSFLYHYLNIALVVLLLYKIYTIIKSKFTIHSVMMNIYYWFISFIFVYIVSAEIDHIGLLLFYQHDTCSCIVLNKTVRIGYPVMWGISSFILMVIGMTRKVRMLRIISLSLFLLTLIKLFSYDIIKASAGGKVIAFIMLGVLLLVISFLYQKLKRILFEDEELDDKQPESGMPGNDNA